MRESTKHTPKRYTYRRNAEIGAGDSVTIPAAQYNTTFAVFESKDGVVWRAVADLIDDERTAQTLAAAQDLLKCAAAPELLEAAETLLHLVETPGDFTPEEAKHAQHDAASAIARATT